MYHHLDGGKCRSHEQKRPESDQLHMTVFEVLERVQFCSPENIPLVNEVCSMNPSTLQRLCEL